MLRVLGLVMRFLFRSGEFDRCHVVGVSDEHAAYVKVNPISPKDVQCTMYHLLGIDHHTRIPNRVGQPVPLVEEGRVVEEMLG